jgi:hypothetical protein
MLGSALATVVLSAGLIASAGAALPRAPQPVPATAADAAPFIGDWTLTLQGPNGPGSFELSIKTDKDKVVGEIANANMATLPITEITKADKTLVLRYLFTWEGNQVDAAVSLTPGAESKTNAQIDFAGGAYTMTGTAAKKEKK